MKTINVGICGLGTVGAGTAQLLEKNASIIQKRTGFPVKVTRAATIDPYEHLDIDFSGIAITNSVDDILNDTEIDVVVELIGGDGLAKKIILEALDKGKSVVTANKALLAKHSEEVFTAAYNSPGFLGYEASVGGGIPIIRSVKEGFSGDEIESFSGIINGTANFILSSMSNENKDFATALKEAQEKGYAEADPTFDIEGIDTAHKVIILMELAFNALFEFDQLHVEGISEIESCDIELAESMGYAIKLLGMARNSQKGFEGKVHPALVKSDSMLANVQGAFNAISVYGNFVGHTMSYGAGAGSHPTASAVVGDIIDIGRRLSTLGGEQVPALSVPLDQLSKQSILPIDETESEYFVRFKLANENDVQAIEDCFQIAGIAIKQLSELKPSTEGSLTPFAILTETVVERRIQALVKDVNNLPFITHPSKIIRVDS